MRAKHCGRIGLDVKVIPRSIFDIDGSEITGGSTFSLAGFRAPPFRIAGKQLGQDDERNLFPGGYPFNLPRLSPLGDNAGKTCLVSLADGSMTIAERCFENFRRSGYEAQWRVLNASSFGVAQLRPRFLLVGFRGTFPDSFQWPIENTVLPPTVGETLSDLMASAADGEAQKDGAPGRM